jgi:hypothetical protein
MQSDPLAVEIIAEQAAEHLREIRRLDDIAYIFLRAAIKSKLKTRLKLSHCPVRGRRACHVEVPHRTRESPPGAVKCQPISRSSQISRLFQISSWKTHA